jgi:flavin-dependent dehydrogenase
MAVGDACGYVEPFTGEGMAWAMHSAKLAVDLLPQPGAQWAPDLAEQWRRVHRAEIRRGQWLCGVMRPMLHHTGLAAAALALGRAMPKAAQFLAEKVCGPPSVAAAIEGEIR